MSKDNLKVYIAPQVYCTELTDGVMSVDFIIPDEPNKKDKTMWSEKHNKYVEVIHLTTKEEEK